MPSTTLCANQGGLRFTPSEDILLISGLEKTGLKKKRWNLIQSQFLSPKTIDQIKNRFKNMIATRAPNNIIKEFVSGKLSQYHQKKILTPVEDALLRKGIATYGRDWDVLTARVLPYISPWDLQYFYEKLVENGRGVLSDMLGTVTFQAGATHIISDPASSYHHGMPMTTSIYDGTYDDFDDVGDFTSSFVDVHNMEDLGFEEEYLGTSSSEGPADVGEFERVDLDSDSDSDSDSYDDTIIGGVAENGGDFEKVELDLSDSDDSPINPSISTG